MKVKLQKAKKPENCEWGGKKQKKIGGISTTG